MNQLEFEHLDHEVEICTNCTVEPDCVGINNRKCLLHPDHGKIKKYSNNDGRRRSEGLKKALIGATTEPTPYLQGILDRAIVCLKFTKKTEKWSVMDLAEAIGAGRYCAIKWLEALRIVLDVKRLKGWPIEYTTHKNRKGAK